MRNENQSRRNALRYLSVLATGSFIIRPLVANSKSIARLALSTNYLIKQPAFLQSIDAKLQTGTNNGDNLDDDSSLEFVLNPKNTDIRKSSTPRAADILFYGRDGTGGYTRERDTKNFKLKILKSDLSKDQINNNYEITVSIQAVGRDHYAGHLELTFHFGDGSIGGLVWDFKVGTYKEANQTSKIISF